MCSHRHWLNDWQPKALSNPKKRQVWTKKAAETRYFCSHRVTLTTEISGCPGGHDNWNILPLYRGPKLLASATSSVLASYRHLSKPQRFFFFWKIRNGVAGWLLIVVFFVVVVVVVVMLLLFCCFVCLSCCCFWEIRLQLKTSRLL